MNVGVVFVVIVVLLLVLLVCLVSGFGLDFLGFVTLRCVS